MRLLICTQAVDADDPVLGFFHAWIARLAGEYEHVTIVCLRVGKHSLPQNVTLKRLRKGRFSRVLAVLLLSLSLRYEAVFVHMNEEYALLMGWLWRLRGARVYLWRNHYQGSLLTDFAALFCTKIFYTSKYSYTAKFEKAAQMPVGVDLSALPTGIPREPRTVLFLGRLAPSKRPELLLEALRLAKEKARATFCGPSDEKYLAGLKHKAGILGVRERVTFLPPIRNSEVPALMSRHEVFVNCSPSGMLDKTIFEAAACGCLVLAASKDWAELIGKEPVEGVEALADALDKALALSPEQQEARRRRQLAVVKKHSLERLTERLVQEMSP